MTYKERNRIINFKFPTGKTREDQAILTTSNSTFKVRRNDYSNVFVIAEQPPKSAVIGGATLKIKSRFY